jgi:dienelactone hydrolase
MKFAMVCLAAMLGATAAWADLPRRGSLGVAIGPAPGGEGLAVIQALSPDTPLKAGDVMLSIDGRPVTGPQGAGPGAQLYGKRAGAKVKLRIRRDGAEQDLDVALIPAPQPVLDGRKVELGEARAPGGPRVRTYLLEPQNKALARNGKSPAVMILPGINCGTVETFQSPNSTYTKFFKRFTDAGVIAVMADKPGQGDSEGTRCEDGGFAVEEQAFRAAAKKFVADKRIDPKRFFIVGISLGGVQAPLVAESAPAAGIVTWGTGVTPWFNYILTTFERRSVIQGEDPTAVLRLSQAWRKVLTAVYVDGKAPAQLPQSMPEDYKIVSDSYGDVTAGFAGRAWIFHTEIDKAPVVRGWNAHKGKLLSLHGEFDWVAEMHDHRLAAEVVNRNRPGDALFEIVPGNDHGATKHATRAESFAKPFQGTPDDTFFTRTVAWVVDVAGQGM